MQLNALRKSNFNKKKSGRSSAFSYNIRAVCTKISVPPEIATPNWWGSRAWRNSCAKFLHTQRAVSRRHTSPHAMGRRPPSFLSNAVRFAPHTNIRVFSGKEEHVDDVCHAIEQVYVAGSTEEKPQMGWS